MLELGSGLRMMEEAPQRSGTEKQRSSSGRGGLLSADSSGDPGEQRFLRKEKVSAGWLRAKGLTQGQGTSPAQRNSVISHPV